MIQINLADFKIERIVDEFKFYCNFTRLAIGLHSCYGKIFYVYLFSFDKQNNWKNKIFSYLIEKYQIKKRLKFLCVIEWLINW